MILYMCNNCKKPTEYQTISVSCNYGSKHDMEELIFCSDKCCAEFFAKSIKEVQEVEKK